MRVRLVVQMIGLNAIDCISIEPSTNDMSNDKRHGEMILFLGSP